MYPVEVWVKFASAATASNGEMAAWAAARQADELFREFRKRWQYVGAGEWTPKLTGEQLRQAEDAAQAKTNTDKVVV